MKGVDINTSDSDGETCLHISARNGHEEIVKLLCDSGADLFIKDRYQMSILLTAANSFKGKFLVDYLLSKGLKFCSRIHEAGFKGDLKNVKRCINELNIKAYKRDKRFNTVLLYAAINGHLHVVRWLLKKGGSRIDERNICGWNALMKAAGGGASLGNRE